MGCTFGVSQRSQPGWLYPPDAKCGSNVAARSGSCYGATLRRVLSLVWTQHLAPVMVLGHGGHTHGAWNVRIRMERGHQYSNGDPELARRMERGKDFGSTFGSIARRSGDAEEWIDSLGAPHRSGVPSRETSVSLDRSQDGKRRVANSASRRGSRR